MSQDIDELFSEVVRKTEEEAVEITSLKAQLIQRCQNAKIEYEEIEFPDSSVALQINLPSGRKKRSVVISLAKEYKRMLTIPFEDYVYIGDYTAICSYKHSYIEAGVRTLRLISPATIYRRLFGIQDTPIDEIDSRAISIEMNRTPKELGQKVTIGRMSNHLYSLASLPPYNRHAFSLKIEGISVTRHDNALEILERLANSIFFEIDVTLDLSLSLLRDRRLSQRRRFIPRKPKVTELEFPQVEYDQEPISLYWYASSARGMPLLQFLAYYQSIEFFFPIYSQNESKRRVRNILKSPGFNMHKDSDVIKVLSAVKSSVGRGFGAERSQLRATIQECLEADALRQFLESDTERKEFFISKAKALSAHKLPIANPSADLRNDVADRIYDLRCKIVHTKTGENEGDVDLLLPFSEEAELMDFDIELIQYVSRQVLVASSRELNI
ncbi:MAG: hypothetical protein H0V27_00140 [Pyrinomonadaceae bacterium]|nr:hypothetical protein [Pyrinomonadaceae bacterium]